MRPAAAAATAENDEDKLLLRFEADEEELLLRWLGLLGCRWCCGELVRELVE